MKIRHHQETDSGGEFVLEDEGGVRGELTYRRVGDTAVVTHTRVDAELRGGGLGRKLVDAASAWARAENLQLRATCWYARLVLDRAGRG